MASTRPSSSISIFIPATNPNDRSAVLVRWLTLDGVAVAEGDAVAIIETSKLSLEIEAPASGYVSHGAMPGQEIEYGRAIGCIMDRQPVPSPDGVATPPEPVRPQRPATQAARELASALSISIEALPGQGLVTLDMVQRLRPPTSDTVDNSLGKEMSSTSLDHPPQSHEPFQKLLGDSLRHAQARTVPSFVSRNVVAGPALRWIDQYITSTGTAVTETDLFLKAIGIALKEFPLLNACSTDRGVTLHPTISIAMAIGTGNQLFSASIENPHQRSLKDIAAWRLGAMRRARRPSRAGNMDRPTFAFSNLAAQRVELFIPNLFPNMAGTLGLGFSAVPQDRWMLCLTFDHMVTNGFYVAGFLELLAQLVEDPGAFANEQD